MALHSAFSGSSNSKVAHRHLLYGATPMAIFQIAVTRLAPPHPGQWHRHPRGSDKALVSFLSGIKWQWHRHPRGGALSSATQCKAPKTSASGKLWRWHRHPKGGAYSATVRFCFFAWLCLSFDIFVSWTLFLTSRLLTPPPMSSFEC